MQTQKGPTTDTPSKSCFSSQSSQKLGKLKSKYLSEGDWTWWHRLTPFSEMLWDQKCYRFKSLEYLSKLYLLTLPDLQIPKKHSKIQNQYHSKVSDSSPSRCQTARCPTCSASQENTAEQIEMPQEKRDEGCRGQMWCVYSITLSHVGGPQEIP